MDVKYCDAEFYRKLKSPEIKEKGVIGKMYHGHFYAVKKPVEQIQEDIRPIAIEEPKSKSKKRNRVTVTQIPQPEREPIDSVDLDFVALDNMDE